jgi:cobalt/nickel transport system ATP-binding protein
LEKNARVAILGSNGAGKSTLLLHFNALHLPQKGSVVVMGSDANKKTEKTHSHKSGNGISRSG